ncbi:6-bladed beta-propeller [Parabacteroides pacaensis]|uniref:6-bladed beta-propeller n=1 Tax=Parabacteroides pacaensis TaxID=2086575 RepID=UPI000D10EC99|nr:6-bladed beta-propeller [Parabacteroides pacaensis]
MKKYIYIILFMIFFSCNKPVVENTVNHCMLISNLEDSLLSLKQIVSEIKMIPLKETDDFLIGTIRKIKKTKTEYFILDDTHTKSLFCFDEAGIPLSKFCHIGNGPDEYIELLDFDINETKKEVAILSYPRNLYIVDWELKTIKKKIQLDQAFKRLVYKDNNLLLYDHSNETLVELNLFNEHFSTFFSWHKLKGHYLFPPQYVFYNVHNKLFFHSPGNDSVYVIKQNECLPYIALDFDHKENTYDLYKSHYNYELPIEKRLQYPLPRIHSFFYVGDQLLFSYTLGIFIFTNIPNLQNPFNRTNVCFTPALSDVTPYGNNTLLGWCNGSDIKDYKNIPIQMGNQNPYQDESIILLEYKLKNSFDEN